MRIAQLVLPGASAYEQKSQRLDAAALERDGGQAVGGQAESLSYTGVRQALSLSAYDLVHVYGPRELPASWFVGFPVPYIASGIVRKPRFALRSPRQPEYSVAPVETDEFTLLPEAVDDAYFATANGQRPTANSYVIGSFDRPAIRNVIEQTVARIRRFRDDIDWHLFAHQPAPDELSQLVAWIDPAVEEDDFDGLTAEALVMGLPVVASRTAINTKRCEQGRTGFLVPPRDPNELVHAILSALFKPEVATPKISAARQTASKFRIRQRLRVLGQIYENTTK